MWGGKREGNFKACHQSLRMVGRKFSSHFLARHRACERSLTISGSEGSVTWILGISLNMGSKIFAKYVNEFKNLTEFLNLKNYFLRVF